MIDARIVDGHGSGNVARVNGEGILNVVTHPHPPRGEVAVAFPFRERFTDSGGSSNMAVDGSVTAVDYTVAAIKDFDVYICTLSVVIGDGGSPALNKFGNLSELPNGVMWYWDSQDEGNIVLHDGIKTNLEFIRVGNKTAGIGTGTDAFLADVSGAATEKSYLPLIDLDELFGLPYGIRLRKDTLDKLVFKVRDDLSTLTTFDIIAYGLKF